MYLRILNVVFKNIFIKVVGRIHNSEKTTEVSNQIKSNLILFKVGNVYLKEKKIRISLLPVLNKCFELLVMGCAKNGLNRLWTLARGQH